jgi:uncharacterized membrane protein
LAEIKSKYVYASLILLVLAFFFWLFSISGIIIILGMFLFFFLPCYIVIRNLDLTQMEKIFFSFFIGWGLFPTCVYYLAIALNSMRLSILISFVVLLVASLAINWRLSKKNKKKEPTA